jgi:Raf kinase inhibitor-like YbhB/YbcL family protein
MPEKATVRILFSVIAIVAAAGCDGRASNELKGDQPTETATLTKISLTSSAFTDGQAIPQQYTCDGDNQSPPLAWGEPPAETKSFALIVDDPDAPGGTFRHWGAYDLPASTRSLAAGQSMGTQAINGFGKPGYGGPCPPPGHGTHHYRFKLYALSVARLELPPNSKVEEVESEARKHAVASGELVGTYERG